MFIKNGLGLLESIETMRGQEQRLNLISNNLANANTSGYKKENVTFWEMLVTGNGSQPRVGKAPKVVTEHTQGAAEPTGNPLDFAISGNGFFRIQTPQGIRYTRSGNFHLNAQGQLATTEGFLVLGQGGPVLLEGKGELSLSPEGLLAENGRPVDQLAIVAAPFEALEKEGLNLFRLREGAQEQAAAEFQLRQGYLEASTVNPVAEMTEMIDLHRAYESQQKLIGIIDSVDGQAIRRVGSLTTP